MLWRGITGALEMVGLATISGTLAVWAQGVPEAPTSILAAFIGVSTFCMGLLGWVLREQITINKRHADELHRLREIMVVICDRLKVAPPKESHHDRPAT